MVPYLRVSPNRGEDKGEIRGQLHEPTMDLCWFNVISPMRTLSLYGS
jgi:hypothetical protein